ncbi:MAG: YceI family protein [Calditrichia bacterium]
MSLFNIFSSMIFFVAATVTLAGAADKFTADPAHTHIGFSVKHMVITNVKGHFKDFSVEFLHDANNLKNWSVKAIIKTASIDTDNERRDNHLRSSDFLAVEEYPEITFVSDNFEKTDDGYVAHGTLTIRGVSKSVELPFKILGIIKDMQGNVRMGIEAGLTINRMDYGVSWDKRLDTGGLVAGNEVNIDINAELIQQK